MANDEAALREALPAMRQGSLRNILVNAAWLMGGKGFSAVLSLVYIALVTRSLGVEGFGRFALALGIAQSVVAFATFQSWQVIVRYGMPHMHEGRHEALARLLRFGALLDLGSALVAAVLVTAGFLILGPHFGWTPGFTLQALGSALALVLSIHSAPNGILRLHDRFAEATYADAITPLVRFVGALVAWFAVPTALAFLAVWALAEMLTAAVYWWFALRVSGVSLRGPTSWAKVRAENPGIAGYAAITNAASSLGQGARQVTVLVVGLLVTPMAAGGFRFAQTLAQSLAKISQTLARAIFPELMRSHAAQAGDPDGFERLFAKTTRMATLGAVAVVVALVAFGRPAMALIAGPAFLPAYPVLLVLGIAAAVDFATLGFEPALTARHRAGEVLRIRLVASSVMFGLMFALAPRFGGLGAAYAVLAASVLAMVQLRYALRRSRWAAATPPSG